MYTSAEKLNKGEMQCFAKIRGSVKAAYSFFHYFFLNITLSHKSSTAYAYHKHLIFTNS